MKRRLMLTVAVVSMTGGFSPAIMYAHAESLQDSMIAAYRNNPTLEAERAALRATDENVNQALSGWRPSVSASGSVSRTNNKQTSNFGGVPNTTDDTFTPRSGQITLTQPLFRGFQTQNSTRQADQLVDAGRAQLLNTEQTVLLDAVAAYMNVLRDVAVLELRRNNVQVLQRQLEASDDRFRVGEITRTDVAQSRARLSLAVSARISAEGVLQTSRAAYAKVVGDMPGSLETPPPLPPLPATDQEAVTTALAQNPVIQAAKASERAAHYAAKVQEGGLLPRVDLKAQYSKAYDTSVFTSNSEQTQISAELTIPLYQAGAQSSRIRQALQVNQQRRLQILESERQVREAVKNAWAGLREARGRIVSTRDQVNANEIALEGVRQEANVGSRTTLDVLDAEQELLDSRVSLVEANRDEYVAAYTLLSAVGSLTAEALALPVDTHYNPDDHYDDVRNQFYGWGAEEGQGWEDGSATGASRASNPVDWDARLSTSQPDASRSLTLPDRGGPDGTDSMWDGIEGKDY